MSKLQISDIIIPEVFNPYVVKRTAELSAFVQSGVMVTDARFNALASGGAKTVNLPFWTPPTGNSQVLSDSGALTPKKLATSKDIAVILARGDAFAYNDLAKFFAGDDPARALGDFLAQYWANDIQDTLISILKGVFLASSMSTNVLDITGESGDAAKFTASTFMDAVAKLGDHSSDLTAIAMHSATKFALAKLNLIATVKPSEGAEFETFQGRRVIVDDSMPVSSTTYTSYIFGSGAVALGNGDIDFPVETARDALGGDNYLVNRKAMIIHPFGVKWQGTAAGASPTNAELETGTNWAKVYETKQIPIVQFKHKIA